MAYDQYLAARIRVVMGGRAEPVEKKMFGGLAFMVNGHMCVGVTGEDLMVRVGPEAYGAALRENGAREMDFTGRPMKGMVFVGSDGFGSDEELGSWVDRGLAFVMSLPPK